MCVRLSFQTQQQQPQKTTSPPQRTEDFAPSHLLFMSDQTFTWGCCTQRANNTFLCVATGDIMNEILMSNPKLNIYTIPQKFCNYGNSLQVPTVDCRSPALFTLYPSYRNFHPGRVLFNQKQTWITLLSTQILKRRSWFINYGHVKRPGDPWAMGQVPLTGNIPDRTVRRRTQTVAKMPQTPIENMVRTNSHTYTQNRINSHNTLYPPKIITLYRVYPRFSPIFRSYGVLLVMSHSLVRWMSVKTMGMSVKAFCDDVGNVLCRLFPCDK